MADPFKFNDLVNALIQRESVWNPMAVSDIGAVGLMQIRPEHAHDLHGKSAPSVFDVARQRGYDVPNENVATARGLLFDPEINMELGVPYLRDLIREHNGNLDIALTAYNAGPTAMNDMLAAGKGPQDMGQEASEYAGHIRRLYREATGMDLPQTMDLMQLTRPQPRPRGLLE